MSEVTGYLEQVDNETYRLRAVLGYKPDGSAKRKSKTIKASSKRAAYKELNIWLEQFEGMTDDSLDLFNITFGEFYRKIWISEAEKNLEPKSYHNYKRMIENRFLDKFDFIPLIDIKPYMIKKIVVNAQRINTKDPGRNSDKPLSRNTKLRMLYAVSNLFLMAKNEYGAIKENPVENVKIPKEKGVKKNIEEPYSEEEIHAMLKAAFEESIEIKTLIVLAFITGARQGEIAALEEQDIDFDKQEIRFHQRISEVDGKSDIRLLPGLKNDDDEKIVTGPAYLFDMLDELIKENKKIRWKLNIKKLRHYFIFDTKQDGTLPRGSYLYKKFKRFTKRHNLRHIRFHDIRHTSATYLLSDPNMTPKELQKRLGHRDFNTTMNVYGHVLRKEKDTAATAFEKLLKKDIK